MSRHIPPGCLAALALAGAVSAHAGSLSVSPLKLTLSSTAGIASLIVENQGRDEALVQTETFSWHQTAGEHQLRPTDDVVAVPPVFRLAPGERQRIRVGLTRAFAEKQEQTFRLMVTEVPTAVAAGTVAVAVRHSLPIFVRPTSPITSKLAVKFSAPGGLALTNVGGGHLRIHRWRLRDGAGGVSAEGSGPGYLLAGATWILAVDGYGVPGHAVFEADSDTRTLKIVVEQ